MSIRKNVSECLENTNFPKTSSRTNISSEPIEPPLEFTRFDRD